ncbi:MAG: DUF1573 domain-containing protein [Saprospiraceae bacterium]
MKKLSFLFLLMAVFGFQQLVAQPMSIDKLAAAEKELANKEYYTALEWYLDAYEDGEDNIQDNVEVINNIATLYSQLRNYRKAASWYKKLINKDKNNKYPNAKYHLGYALKIDGKYTEALEALNDFMANSGDAGMKERAKIEIAGVKLAQSLPAADPEIIVENKTTRNFSTAYTEWSPLYASETEMYYSTMNSDKVVYRKGDYHQKIYKSTKTGDDWSAGTVLAETVNKKGVHNGTVTISADGNYMYFSRAAKTGEELTSSKIYVAEKSGGSWSEAKEVEGLNDAAYLTTQPSFGKVNGKNALFFTSDMPGGKGGYDIYVAILKSPTSVEPPINLGDDVNTPLNDQTPFYKDDQLYFASNGHPNLGGYDIFVADQNGVKWDNVENLGKSVNSEYDELYFVLDQEGYHGFMVSNRKGTKTIEKTSTFDKEDSWRTSGDDIWTVTFPKPVFANLDVRVFNQDDKPVKGVTIELREKGAANGQVKTNPRGNKFEFPLDLDKEYEVIATRDCYDGSKEVISTMNVTDSKTFVTEFTLNEDAPKITSRRIKKQIKSESGKPIVLSGLNFDLAKWNIRPDAEPALIQVLNLMNKYPAMIIELSSHTDSRGSKPANERLSERRATSSKEWLVTRGIAADRIVAKGYGETQLLNECADGVTCDEASHEMNRRTEFKITSGPTEIVIESFKDEYETVYDTTYCAGLKGATGSTIDINGLNTTELVFEKEAHDFGNVKKGETVEHTFKFTNIGKEKLVVEFASGSCGCTVPDYPKNAIAPGETGEIKVVYTAKEDKEIGLEDQQEVTIIANTEPPVSLVTITAKIVE